jgi:hypothetical protein
MYVTGFCVYELVTFRSRYSPHSTLFEVQASNSEIFKVVSLKVMHKGSPIYETLGLTMSRCAHDSVLVGKVLCVMAIFSPRYHGGYCLQMWE